MSDYESTVHLRYEIDRLRETNYHLREISEKQKLRIKQLEEALTKIIKTRNSAQGAGQYVTLDAIERIATKAKEAKP